MYALTLDVLGFEMSHVLVEQRTYCEMAVVHTFRTSVQKRAFITASAVIIPDTSMPTAANCSTHRY